MTADVAVASLSATNLPGGAIRASTEVPVGYSCPLTPGLEVADVFVFTHGADGQLANKHFDIIIN